MTAPRFTRRNYGAGHSYTLDGAKITGVTTVLNVLNKPGLVNWAAETTAGFAIENWVDLADLPLMERYDRMVKARFETNRRAVVRGNRIHEFGDKLAHGEAVEVPDEYRTPADAYARFLDLWDMETILTETSVCHTDYRYGGTFDAIVKAPKLGTVMIDIKTGGVWDEVALQLAAYRFANLMIDDRPMIPTDAAFVAHVLPDTVDLVPIRQDEAIVNAFLYLLEIYETWTKRTSWDFKAEATFDPPVGQVIYPDQISAA
jgi:hypothetical protein